MRYAIIAPGTGRRPVENVAKAEPAFAESQGWVQSDTAGPGWTYDADDPEPFLPPEPSPQAKLASITKMQFLPLLVGAIGEERAITLLGSPTKFAVVYAAAEKIDYEDVFVMVDGDPQQPCYSAQLLAAGAATEEEVANLEASWPTG